MTVHFTRLALLCSIASLSACAEMTETASGPAPGTEGSLEWAAAGAWRTPAEIARDGVRKPVDELKFIGIKPNYNVVEINPGGGYFTGILGPYLAKGQGSLTEASGKGEPSKTFKERFLDHPETFGKIKYVPFNATSGAIAEGTADAVVTFRNVHNWMDAGFGDKAFQDFFRALKPGGVLGVEEHRAPATGVQDPKAANGYVQEAYVKQLAAKAGFEFVKSSELLANAKDTKDHPFGVWTLPPVLQSSKDGKPDPAFDQTKYKAIGEADNMLLVFRKPGK
jgi:predicted methyltransferase